MQKLFINYYKAEKYKESISDINYQLNKGIEEDDFSIIDRICRRLKIKKEELHKLLLNPSYVFVQSLFFSEVQQINFLKDKTPKPKLLSKLVSRLGFDSIEEAIKTLQESNTILFDTVIMDEASKATPPEML